MSATREKRDKESLAPSQRIGELVGIAVMSVGFWFFAYHQAAHTGFFTSAFGPPEMFFVYGPILFAMLAPLARALIGRRNPARPLEATANLFSALSALWLLIIFPFNFAHLADPLPDGLRFLLSWINNDIGRVALIIELIVCPITAIVAAWQYLTHLGRETTNPWAHRGAHRAA